MIAAYIKLESLPDQVKVKHNTSAAIGVALAKSAARRKRKGGIHA